MIRAPVAPLINKLRDWAQNSSGLTVFNKIMTKQILKYTCGKNGFHRPSKSFGTGPYLVFHNRSAIGKIGNRILPISRVKQHLVIVFVWYTGVWYKLYHITYIVYDIAYAGPPRKNVFQLILPKSIRDIFYQLSHNCEVVWYLVHNTWFICGPLKTNKTHPNHHI